MKAYKATSDCGEHCVVSIAETRGKAKYQARHAECGFDDMADYWNEIQCVRYPAADCFIEQYGPGLVPWKGNERWFRNEGWNEYDNYQYCECCGRHVFEGIPESKVTDHEDHGEICQECLKGYTCS